MESITALYGTFWALLPPIIAIALALLTKEVYSSLFVGIVVGGFLFSGGSFVGAMNHIFLEDIVLVPGEPPLQFGMINVIADTYNVGILIFLVFLGIIVQLMNRAGGSAAFGEWASKRIRTRVGAQLATMALGILIFIDDYFNCLTVGSVMRPVTDRHNVSRAKLAYLIDATAAPVCIIAPISSWAAAVSGFAPEGTNGLLLFIKAIPYNYYAILTFVMIISVVLLKIDYGPMARHEMNAIKNNDLFTVPSPGYEEEKGGEKNGKVIDLVLPIVCLVICCVIGMIYTGGFFDGESFIDAFANCDASLGLVLGCHHPDLVHRPRHHEVQGLHGVPVRGLQGHGPRHYDPGPGLDTEEHDRFPGGRRVCGRRGGTERRRFQEPASRHHLRNRMLLILRNGNLLGHLRHPDPHYLKRIPAGECRDHLRDLRFRLHGRRCLR